MGCGLFHWLAVSHSQIAMIHPDAVTSCNVDLESLISDNNRSIATLAITTLLKVGGWVGGWVGACACVRLCENMGRKKDALGVG